MTTSNHINNDTILTQNEPKQLWVVFSGESDIRWIKMIFRKGFRHCYTVMNDGAKWVTCDPLAHKLELSVHHQIPATFDLPQWLTARGLKVVPVRAPFYKKKSLPPAFFTCVEAVKRMIGVRKMRVLTPYQLFRYLERQQQGV